MFDFKSILNSDEVILYQGKSNVSNISKNIMGELFIIFVTIIFDIVLFVFPSKLLLGLIAVGIFQILCVWSIFNTLFLKKGKVIDNLYCITNIRAIKYDLKSGILYFGYLANYSNNYVINEKNGYGDLVLKISGNHDKLEFDGVDLITFSKNVTSINRHPKLDNMPFINFEGIENPRAVLDIVNNAKSKLQNIDNFTVADLSNFIN